MQHWQLKSVNVITGVGRASVLCFLGNRNPCCEVKLLEFQYEKVIVRFGRKAYHLRSHALSLVYSLESLWYSLLIYFVLHITGLLCAPIQP